MTKSEFTALKSGIEKSLSTSPNAAATANKIVNVKLAHVLALIEMAEASGTAPTE